MFETAWRAGSRAWRDGVPLESLYIVAGKRGKAYARRHKNVTPRVRVCQAFDYAAVFHDGYLSAGNDAAGLTVGSGVVDEALAARLRHAELRWREMPGSDWYAVCVQKSVWQRLRGGDA